MKFAQLIALLLALTLAGQAHASYDSEYVKATGTSTARTAADHFSDHYFVKKFGAFCDFQAIHDVSSTNGSAVVTSTAYNFTSADIGKVVNMVTAGITATTIVSVNGHSATLATQATITGTNLAFWFGHDDTPAFARGEAAMAAAGGNATLFFQGKCFISQVVMTRFTMIDGINAANSQIISIGGSNKDTFVSENLSDLEDSGLNYGPTGTFNGFVSDPRVPSWFGVRNFHADGNRFNGNTSGRLYAGWGNMQIIKDVNFEGAAGDCVYTGAAGAFAYNSTDYRAEEEGEFENVTTRGCGGYEWKYHGPHDAHLHNIIGYGSAHGFLQQSGSGSVTGSYSGGANFELMHFYTEADGVSMTFNSGGQANFIYGDFGEVIIGAGMIANNVRVIQCGFNGQPCLSVSGTFVEMASVDIQPQLTQSTINTRLVQITGQFVNMTGLSVPLYNLGAGNTGVYIGNNFNSISGTVNGGIGLTGDACVSVNGSFNRVDIAGANCNAGIALATGEHNNVLKQFTFGSTIPFSNAAATASATPDKSDNVTVDDSGGTSYTQMPKLILPGSTSGVFSLTAPAVAGSLGIQFPSTAGTSGQFLQTNGAGVTSWATPSGGGGAVSSVSNSDGSLTISPTTGSVVASLNYGNPGTWTAAQTFAAGLNIPPTRVTSSQTLTAAMTDVSVRAANSVTLTLPSSPADGNWKIIEDALSHSNGYPITIAPGSGDTITNSSTSFVLNSNGAAVTLRYDATNHNWDILNVIKQ